MEKSSVGFDALRAAQRLFLAGYDNISVSLPKPVVEFLRANFGISTGKKGDVSAFIFDALMHEFERRGYTFDGEKFIGMEQGKLPFPDIRTEDKVKDRRLKGPHLQGTAIDTTVLLEGQSG